MFHGTYQGEDENIDYYVEPKNIIQNQINLIQHLNWDQRPQDEFGEVKSWWIMHNPIRHGF